MEKFFEYRDRWGNGLALWVVLVMVFAIPFIAIGVGQLKLENEVTNWLPEDDPDAKVLNWFHNQFEHESRMIVSWDSSALLDPRTKNFADRLLGNIPGTSRIEGVENVTTPQDVIQRMLENTIDEQTAVDRLSGVLIGAGFLKVQLTEAGLKDIISSQQQVLQVAQQVTAKEVALLPRVPEYEVPQTAEPQEVPVLDNADDVDTEGDIEESTGQYYVENFEIPPHDFQLRWKEISPYSPVSVDVIKAIKELPSVKAVFFASGAPVAVSISINQYGDENLGETIESIQATALASGVEADELRMGGAPVGRNRLNKEAARATWNPDYPIWNLYKRTPVLLSTVVSILISFFLLRSFRLAMLVIVASTFTVAVVLAMIPAVGKSLNMVLIVLPNLLLVLTTSGAIHVANYWKHSAYNKEKNPIAHAVGMAAQPCMLASITTAIGMASLITAVLSPVREFGIFSAIGSIISLLMVLIGFPSLMSVWPAGNQNTAPETESEARFWGHSARILLRYRNLVTSLCLILFIFSVVGLQYFRTETKVIRYFPSHTRIVADYDFLEEGLAGLVSIDTVIRFNKERCQESNILERMELVRKAEQKISEHRWISGTLSLADFRPAVDPPAATASFRDKVLYGRRAQRTENVIFGDESKNTQDFTRHASAPLQIPHRDRQITFKEGDEVWRIRCQSIVMGDVDYEVLTNEMNAITASAIGTSPGTDYVVTGMVPLFLRTQEAVLQSLIQSFGLAFAIIAVVMIALLKNPVSGFLAMLPNVFPIAVVFGIVSWVGIPVDIGTMITASVALGIAIDGTLHLLAWFQDGIRKGLSRNEAVEKALQHCGPAMWQTSASISLGIVMLAGADLLLISRFGILMASLVMVALFADVVLLPAMLGGWLGTLIAKSLGVDVHQFSDQKTPAQSIPIEPAQSLTIYPGSTG